MPDDDYEDLMQEDKAARERQGLAIAATLNGLGPDAGEAWEYAPLPHPVSVTQVLAVLECAHAMGIVEWESWHDG